MSNEIITHKFRELLLPSILIAMALNITIIDFKLSKEDIEKIKEIDGGESPFIDHLDPETVQEFNEEII